MPNYHTVHEDKPNFNDYYSFDIDDYIHIISINSNLIVQKGLINSPERTNMIEWLQGDFKKIKERENKPIWTIVLMHQSLYCVTERPESFKCNQQARHLRNALEELFVENDVSLVIAGHNHDLERSYALKYGVKTEPRIEGEKSIYDNPGAPIYLICGASGSRIGLSKNQVEHDLFEKFSTTLGICGLSITRKELNGHFIDIKEGGKLFDEFVIRKPQVNIELKREQNNIKRKRRFYH
jgi:hypothetical protein